MAMLRSPRFFGRKQIVQQTDSLCEQGFVLAIELIWGSTKTKSYLTRCRMSIAVENWYHELHVVQHINSSCKLEKDSKCDNT